MRVSLSERVLAELGPAIAGGDLGPGDVIRLEEIEQRFDVSRTVAREAVKVLESLQMVESRRRVGAEILPRERWSVTAPQVMFWRLQGPHRLAELHAIGELREGIEPIAARLAALNATEQERVRLLELGELLEETGARGELEIFLGFDIEYHQLMLRASRNPLLASFAGTVEQVLTARTHHHLMPPQPKPEARAWHRAAAAAVARGDAKAAEEAVRNIVSEAGRGIDEMAAERSSTQTA